MSIAGGYATALLRGQASGCRTIQIFTKNPNRWQERRLHGGEVRDFLETQRKTGIRPVIAHGSYLVNLASPDPFLFKKSIQALTREIRRCGQLRIPCVVIHPGAHGGRGEAPGLKRVVQAIDALAGATEGSDVKIVLETTAGQGTGLGSRFEHLAWILRNVSNPGRLGFCFDSCHAFAAGYDFTSPRAYEALIRCMDRTVGLCRLEVIHFNDSVKKIGSRVDRHEHIGRGEIGLEAFERLMRDRRLAHIPKILETPKSSPFEKSGDPMDAKNLALLRRLAAAGKR